MAIVGGDIDIWAKQFPQDQVKNILKLVLRSWKTFDSQAETQEVPLTRKFCGHLRNNKDRLIDFFRIEWESCELDEEARVTGRIDLKFLQGLEEKVYFSIECKRLRVTLPSGFKTLANDYVNAGMYRYFSGQYATGLDKGGMLGYVMDGQVKKAIGDVTSAIHGQRKKLYMDDQQTLRPSHVLSSAQVKETKHNYGPQGTFVVYHIFLPYQN